MSFDRFWRDGACQSAVAVRLCGEENLQEPFSFLNLLQKNGHDAWVGTSGQ